MPSARDPLRRLSPTGGPWRRVVDVARALIGAPDYERYLAHQAAHHPGAVPLDRAAFFAARQAARFARGATRCC